MQDTAYARMMTAYAVDLVKAPNTRAFYVPGIARFAGYRPGDTVEVACADTGYGWERGTVRSVTGASDGVFDVSVTLDNGADARAFGTEIRPYR